MKPKMLVPFHPKCQTSFASWRAGVGSAVVRTLAVFNGIISPDESVRQVPQPYQTVC
jgi:hypothetical protein